VRNEIQNISLYVGTMKNTLVNKKVIGFGPAKHCLQSRCYKRFQGCAVCQMDHCIPLKVF
jgi:hypothetical protein